MRDLIADWLLRASSLFFACAVRLKNAALWVLTFGRPVEK